MEYALLIGMISLQAAKSLPLVAEGVNCILNKTTDLLYGVAKNITQPIVKIEFGQCSAKVIKCKPCSPVPAGEFGYRLDGSPQRPHWDKPSQGWITGAHWHMYVCNQRPPEAGCTCNWEPMGIAASGSLPFGVDITTTACSGGGFDE
jgi:hypothetical protein